MKYKTIGVGLGRDSRNDLNSNFDEIDKDIKALVLQSGDTNASVGQAMIDAANAKTTANEAKTTADGINAIAVDANEKATTAEENALLAKTTAETVQNEFDLVVAEAGSNNPEVVQARGEFTNLKGRLDSTAQQLADTTEEVVVNKPTTRRNLPRRPLITIIDDDGKKVAYTRLMPMLEERGMVGSCALITSRLGTNFGGEAYMTKDDVKDLMSKGWEMLGHTHDAHSPSMLNYTTEYLIEDTKECRRQLGLLGSTSRGFVYPQSNDTETIQQVVQKHFDYSFGRTGINQSENINVMNITRIGVGQPWGTSDINVLKGHVDDVKANGGWLVFMLHVANQLENDWAVLAELLDYIVSENVEVANPTEAYDIYGAKFFTGNRFGKYLSVVGESIYGNFDLKLTGNIMTKKLAQNTKKSTDGITTYSLNEVTQVEISSAYAGGVGDFPEKKAGILITHHYNVEYPMFSWQEYHVYASTVKYVRYPLNQTSWSEWEKQGSGQGGVASGTDIETKFNAVTNEMLPSAFIKTITIHRMTSAYALSTNFPTNNTSILTTVIAGDTNFAYQELKSLDNVIFVRIGINNVWNPWIKQNDISKIATVTARTIQPKSSEDVTRDLASYNMYHGKKATVVFDNPLPNGLMYKEWVKGDTLYIRFANITDVPVELPASPYTFMV